MNDTLVPTDEKEIPTTWPRKLYAPAPFYYHPSTKTFRRNAAKLREQALERYRRDPAKWIKAVQRWRENNAEHVQAYAAWWYVQNRERRLIEMREYTRKRRAAKRQANESGT